MRAETERVQQLAAMPQKKKKKNNPKTMTNMYYTIYHYDGGVTLAEITKERRSFINMESESMLVNYLNGQGIDMPIDNVITETKEQGWSELLEAKIAERSAE